EIQKARNISDSNFYAIHQGIAWKYRITCEAHNRPEGVLQFISYTSISDVDIYIFLGNFPPLRIIPQEDWDKFIWFPRQDQLEKMLDLVGCKISFYYTNHWIVDYNGITQNFNFSAKTLEQAWLFIVMRVRYNKTWNWKDNKWVDKTTQ
ncbi:unnamed protein product, partial [marine sediment metagenome]